MFGGGGGGFHRGGGGFRGGGRGFGGGGGHRGGGRGHFRGGGFRFGFGRGGGPPQHPPFPHQQGGFGFFMGDGGGGGGGPAPPVFGDGGGEQPSFGMSMGGGEGGFGDMGGGMGPMATAEGGGPASFGNAGMKAPDAVKQKMSANVKTDPSDAQGNSMATAAAIASLSGGGGNVSTVEVKDVKLEAAAVPKVERQPALPTEDEPEYDDSLVILDWYNSDLNLQIDKNDFCSAKAMSERGFGYVWAGARATYGATLGKVCFEVRIDANNPVDHLEGEACPNVLRVGWSANNSGLQLGEEPLSFGYGGTAKASVGCKFKDYGIRFGVGDVIGCYLDLTLDPVQIRYTVNGLDQGVAFRTPKTELDGQALFPHILTKNQNFTVNFGQLPAPMCNLLPNYSPVGQLDLSDGLVRGSQPPPSRDACECLLMIGLPGAGKTYWAENYARQRPDKRYNVLGTNSLIDRMKVQGLPRKHNYHGRWDVLISKCTECFNDLLKLAVRRRRNYILDQTNVFPTARERKMSEFNGFLCKAIVVVPTDQEFQRRVEQRERAEGKEIPDNAVLNMKANFVLPDIAEVYLSEVLYTELGPNDAAQVVQQYNNEAFEKGVQMTRGVKQFVKSNTAKRQSLGVFDVIGKLLREEDPVSAVALASSAPKQEPPALIEQTGPSPAVKKGGQGFSGGQFGDGGQMSGFQNQQQQQGFGSQFSQGSDPRNHGAGPSRENVSDKEKGSSGPSATDDDKIKNLMALASGEDPPPRSSRGGRDDGNSRSFRSRERDSNNSRRRSRSRERRERRRSDSRDRSSRRRNRTRSRSRSRDRDRGGRGGGFGGGGGERRNWREGNNRQGAGGGGVPSPWMTGSAPPQQQQQHIPLFQGGGPFQGGGDHSGQSGPGSGLPISAGGGGGGFGQGGLPFGEKNPGSGGSGGWGESSQQEGFGMPGGNGGFGGGQFANDVNDSGSLLGSGPPPNQIGSRGGRGASRGPQGFGGGRGGGGPSSSNWDDRRGQSQERNQGAPFGEQGDGDWNSRGRGGRFGGGRGNQRGGGEFSRGGGGRGGRFSSENFGDPGDVGHRRDGEWASDQHHGDNQWESGRDSDWSGGGDRGGRGGGGRRGFQSGNRDGWNSGRGGAGIQGEGGFGLPGRGRGGRGRGGSFFGGGGGQDTGEGYSGGDQDSQRRQDFQSDFPGSGGESSRGGGRGGGGNIFGGSRGRGGGGFPGRGGHDRPGIGPSHGRTDASSDNAGGFPQQQQQLQHPPPQSGGPLASSNQNNFQQQGAQPQMQQQQRSQRPPGPPPQGFGMPQQQQQQQPPIRQSSPFQQPPPRQGFQQGSPHRFQHPPPQTSTSQSWNTSAQTIQAQSFGSQQQQGPSAQTYGGGQGGYQSQNQQQQVRPPPQNQYGGFGRQQQQQQQQQQLQQQQQQQGPPPAPRFTPPPQQRPNFPPPPQGGVGFPSAQHGTNAPPPSSFSSSSSTSAPPPSSDLSWRPTGPTGFMNLPNPNPSPSMGGLPPTSPHNPQQPPHPSTSASSLTQPPPARPAGPGGGAPDYTELLKYLQFYQKKMSGGEGSSEGGGGGQA